MPLVIMVGAPCSGKTTRAHELAKYIREQKAGIEVTIVNEESLNIDRKQAYSSSVEEKAARSAFRGAVERHVSSRMVVIADSLNFIKGLRYELYCRAREAATTHCVIYCDTELETCIKYNEERDEKLQYEADRVTSLFNRMEHPNGNKRWDKPLFTVTADDKMPTEDIYNVLIHGEALRPSVSTVKQVVSETNTLHELDRVTQEIVKSIVDAHKIMGPGDPVKVPHCDLEFTCSRTIGLAELRRLRRQYIKVAQLRVPDSIKSIAEQFTNYLNTNA
jgi:protein KTI12